jgi:large subunit ribosomal protein L9
MQVVLVKRVPKLGYEHDVVEVKPGFAQNFLFPQKMAIPATKADLRRAQILKSKRLEKLEAVIANAKAVADKLKDVVLTFTKKVRGEKLYGSISEKDIVEALAEQSKVEIQKDMVSMTEHIKALGEFKIKLHLAEGVEVPVKVVVKSEE